MKEPDIKDISAEHDAEMMCKGNLAERNEKLVAINERLQFENRELKKELREAFDRNKELRGQLESCMTGATSACQCREPRDYKREFMFVTDVMNKLYQAKNANYGNSYSDLFKKYGDIAAIIPMHNKLNRIESIIKKGTIEGNCESLWDSVIDLCCYGVMYAMELQKK